MKEEMFGKINLKKMKSKERNQRKKERVSNVDDSNRGRHEASLFNSLGVATPFSG